MQSPLNDESRELESIVSVAIVLLAAGEASRMGKGKAHKLLAEFDCVPLVRRAAMTALGADAVTVVVVTGHRGAEIESALSGLALISVENHDYASGMASSLIAGFGAAGVNNPHGVLVMLADMPWVTTADINALIATFRSSLGQAVVRAVSNGKPGNPVILPRSLADAVLRLVGDVGARHIVEMSGLPVIEVDIGEAAHMDVDTPEDVIDAGGILRA
ncbi:nucleotidyltransferase family protein [Pararhizobium sp. PWRC1-1]|uniref:nucleotidyltransferase family protein n=1 Tax=Pararhizobium sp. PWRC1-1 TaxID=2804566 RepID=UPI003CF922A2